MLAFTLGKNASELRPCKVDPVDEGSIYLWKCSLNTLPHLLPVAEEEGLGGEGRE